MKSDIIMETLTVYIAAVSRMKRVNLPQSGLGWTLLILGFVVVYMAGSKSLLEKFTQSGSMKIVLKIAICLLGFFLIYMATAID